MSFNSLLKQVPAVLRARGFRLYTTGNKRLIDLWLNGGAAVLGHTPPNFLREIKNTASRGLYAPYPRFTENRLVKALSKLLPGCFFRLYAAPPEELLHLQRSLQQNREIIKIWRPFMNKNEPFAIKGNNLYHIPVIPGIQTWRKFTVSGNSKIYLPMGLCVIAAENEAQHAHLPSNEILPPVLLATAARGIYDIIAASQQRGKPARACPAVPRTFKALQSNQDWVQNGIYLTLKRKPSNEEWAALFAKFLEAGFLLPPVPEHPLILPGELSQGEDAKLAKVIAL